MLRNLKYKVDSNESIRRLRRYVDSHVSYRKLFIILLIITIILLYFGPKIIGYFTRSEQTLKDPLARCLDDRLTPFYMKSIEFNANIRHNPAQSTRESLFVPYVGNGFMGVDITPNAKIYIKYGRYLSQPVLFHPIISVTHRSTFQSNEAYVVDYLNGFVHRFQCFDIGFYVSYEYYAHRFIPAVFVQEIKITNTMTQMIDVDLTGSMSSNWINADRQLIKLQHGSTIAEYAITTGIVEPNAGKDEIIVVTIVARHIPKSVTLRKRGVTKLEFLLTINYSEPIARDKYSKTRVDVEKGAIDSMQKALQNAEHNNEENKLYNFKRLHMQIWKNLWLTGFEISSSLAEDSINGDRINATIYAVLSQVRSLESEDGILLPQKLEIDKILNNVEGCYDTRHHTLQAENLWRNMKTIDELNSLVSSWLLTLEKQGCHNLIKAGASGVIQAMVLSFGGFRFSNQHLEFNIHPKYLHRDYFYRRIRYGNMTHVNVSVAVTDDNKAVMYVALDRSDGQYYACDAGCLDDPVKLGPEKTMFPVKLTDPLTAILYIASDREHILELHHAIHVKEVAEAPAHEHHIIALHKHGHHLGGLPTLFWISICAIIIVFHVFLCKLIVKEYCEPPDKFRYRYVKPYGEGTTRTTLILASASAYEVENEVNYSNSNGQQYDLPLYHKLFDPATEPLLQETFVGSIFGKLSSVTFEWKNGSDSEYTFLIRDMVQGTLQAQAFVSDLNIIVKDMDGNEMLHIRNGTCMHTFEAFHNDGSIGSVELASNDSVDTCLKINSVNTDFVVKSLHFGDFEIFRDQSSPNPLCNIKIPYAKVYVEKEFSGTIIFHPETGITKNEQLLCTAAAIAFKVTRKRCLENKDKNTTCWAYFWGIVIVSVLIGLAVFFFH